MPSIVRFSPVLEMVSVGGMSVTVPVEVVMPSPAVTMPCGPGATRLPYI